MTHATQHPTLVHTSGAFRRFAAARDAELGWIIELSHGSNTTPDRAQLLHALADACDTQASVRRTHPITAAPTADELDGKAHTARVLARILHPSSPQRRSVPYTWPYSGHPHAVTHLRGIAEAPTVPQFATGMQELAACLRHHDPDSPQIQGASELLDTLSGCWHAAYEHLLEHRHGILTPVT